MGLSDAGELCSGGFSSVKSQKGFCKPMWKPDSVEGADAEALVLSSCCMSDPSSESKRSTSFASLSTAEGRSVGAHVQYVASISALGCEAASPELGVGSTRSIAGDAWSNPVPAPKTPSWLAVRGRWFDLLRALLHVSAGLPNLRVGL